MAWKLSPLSPVSAQETIHFLFISEEANLYSFRFSEPNSARCVTLLSIIARHCASTRARIVFELSADWKFSLQPHRSHSGLTATSTQICLPINIRWWKNLNIIYCIGWQQVPRNKCAPEIESEIEISFTWCECIPLRFNILSPDPKLARDKMDENWKWILQLRIPLNDVCACKWHAIFSVSISMVCATSKAIPNWFFYSLYFQLNCTPLTLCVLTSRDDRKKKIA